MKSKYAVLTSMVLAGLIAMVGFGYMIQQNPKSFLAFAVGSQPDSYGNKINFVAIYQNRGGGQWSTSIQYSAYQSGMTVEIVANYPTWIMVSVFINQTLVTGAPADIVRVYLSVAGVKTNELMTVYGTYGPAFGFYQVLHNSTQWTPESGVTYGVTVNYQAYY